MFFAAFVLCIRTLKKEYLKVFVQQYNETTNVKLFDFNWNYE